MPCGMGFSNRPARRTIEEEVRWPVAVSGEGPVFCTPSTRSRVWASEEWPRCVVVTVSSRISWSWLIRLRNYALLREGGG
jgi:hypothetical protein